MKRVMSLLSGLALLPALLPAQGIGVSAARWLSSPHVSEYRLGLDGFAYGPFSFRPAVQYLTQGGESKAYFAGAGGDVILRATANAMPFLIGGAALGMARGELGGGMGPGIGAWGGAGAELLAVGPLGVQVEALYTWRSRMHVQSVSLGLRIGSRIGRERAEERLAPLPSGSGATASGMALPAASPEDEATLRLATAARLPRPTGMAGDVVSSAIAVMGTPYRWGGSDGNGFDCSGLIQFAYAQHGISVPRTSGEQAQAGNEIGRYLEQLWPGDILTFSDQPGSGIAHVGLYLGEGKFIHSANGGVQTSVLSPTDAAGRWWWERWVGARRILAQ
ncbi:MAG TPA: C40 family peptidase [Gemmatimonadales bacterium]|nr:C40 family peptidase [Gemmatimonadales bacterium]